MSRKSVLVLTAILAVIVIMAVSLQGKQEFQVAMVSTSLQASTVGQSAWSGIQQAERTHHAAIKYIELVDGSLQGTLKEIERLYNEGYKTIVFPGVAFEQAVTEAQVTFKGKGANFITVDFAPQGEIQANTVALLFAEHQAGFMAGVATALELKEGQAGAVLARNEEPVQTMWNGFMQGVAYSNAQYGTALTINPNHILYTEEIRYSKAGKELGTTLYGQGVKVVFVAAGAAGNGVINSAIEQVKAENAVWVVGNNIDWYHRGVYDETHSVVLTSAVKRVDDAVYSILKQISADGFVGGRYVMHDVQTNSVGLPQSNPNLSAAVVNTCNEVYTKIRAGEIIVKK